MKVDITDPRILDIVEDSARNGTADFKIVYLEQRDIFNADGDPFMRRPDRVELDSRQLMILMVEKLRSHNQELDGLIDFLRESFNDSHEGRILDRIYGRLRLEEARRENRGR